MSLAISVMLLAIWFLCDSGQSIRVKSVSEFEIEINDLGLYFDKRVPAQLTGPKPADPLIPHWIARPLLVLMAAYMLRGKPQSRSEVATDHFPIEAKNNAITQTEC